MGQYTISFDLNGGGVREDVSWGTGSSAWYRVMPPERAGYVFDGWVVTGHNRKTAMYSVVSGTGVRIKADPALIPVYPTSKEVSVAYLNTGEAGDNRTVLTAKWRRIFGYGSTCPTVEVPAFSPICSKPEVTGSTPLTLDVPVPVFAPIVPPPECACFTFVKPTSDVTAETTPTCTADNKAKVSVNVDIQPVGDCCNGKYKITPNVSLELPCMPFSVNAATVNLRNRSGETTAAKINGTAALQFTKDCCVLKPTLNLTLPDCIPYYAPGNALGQVRACSRKSDGTAETKTLKVAELIKDEKHCSLYPKLYTVDIPCCMQEDTTVSSTSVPLANLPGGGTSGTLTVTLKRVNCEPQVEVNVTRIDIPAPGGGGSFCLDNGSLTLTPKYTDASGTEQSGSPTTITLQNTAGTNGCRKYTGSGTINLGAIPGFSNGGSVFKDDDDNNLYMDGGLGDGNTWYGGGIGDRAADSYEEEVFCRGPAMRGYASPAGSGDHPVPYVDNVSGNTSLFKITADGGTKKAVAWCSRGRASDGSDAVGATPSGYVDGNLSMVLPTGFQWHARGLAINLCDFDWNESGLLSLMHETGRAVLVSPAPAYHKPGTAYAGHNASGLAVFAAGNVDHGLSVKFGEGLRIFGASDRTDRSELADIGTNTATQARMGRLEVMYGPGFRIRGADSGGSPTYRNVPRDIDGALVLNDGYGIRVFGTDSKTDTSEKTTANTTVGNAAYRVGKVEILYGPGFRIRGASTNTYYDKPRDIEGALVPNDGRGLRVHNVTKKTTRESAYDNQLEVFKHDGDFLFNGDKRLVLNDKPNDTGVSDAEVRLAGGGDPNGPYIKDYYNRDKDCTVSVLTTWIDSTNAYWSTHTNSTKGKSVYKVDTGLLDGDLDDAEQALWEHTDAGYSLKRIFSSSSYNVTAIQELSKACAALFNCVIDIEETIAHLAVVRMHFGKGGMLMAADTDKDCATSANSDHLTRHYSTSAS